MLAPRSPLVDGRSVRGWALGSLAVAFASLSIATYLEAKPLWAAYNALGVLFTLTFALVIRRLRVPLPGRATALCYIAVCLHYVGGSLGGHFGVAGVNGLYAKIAWYDRVTHFAGAAGVALLCFHLLGQLEAAHGWVISERAVAIFAFTIAMTLGVFTELFEFAAWTFFGTVDQGFYSNTMMDLFTDTAGATFGTSASLALRPVGLQAGAVDVRSR